MVEYIMIDEMLTNESSDTAAYMSALQLELSEISPQNKKKAPSLRKGTKRMLVVPPFFLPTYQVRRSSRLANGLGTGERLSPSLLSR